MTQAVSAKRMIARIQRLCCLGLGDQIAIPQLLRDLHGLVPSHSNTFFWAGPNQELANMFSDAPIMAELAPLCLQEFHNNREREVMLTFTEAMRTNYASPAGNFFERVLKVPHSEFVRGDMYNLLWNPAGWHKAMFLKITDHRNRGLGALNLSRSASDPEFTRRDVFLLEAVGPFVAHALTTRAPADPFVDSDDSGLVLADGNGRVQYVSRAASRLLKMVHYPAWSPQIASQMGDNVLPEEVVRLCRSLAWQREDHLLPAPPVWRHRNAWGEFLFRVHAIEPSTAPAAPNVVGVIVNRREPLALKIFRSVSELGLSQRECQLCLGLAGAHSRAMIADAMGISEHTVISHCRNLYAKLGVHSRAELQEKLREM